MARATIFLFWLLFASVPVAHAAPELSESDQQRLEDGTTLRGKWIDREDGFYVLIRNAKEWKADDFSGTTGQAVAPSPDYDYLMDHPGEVLGNVFLIEGIFEQQVRYPTGDKPLFRAGNPDWGDRVTRWVIRTSDDPTDAVVVFFHDPEGKIVAPRQGSKVRVAARFYKVWLTDNDSGQAAMFLAFVGGARDVVAPPGGGLSLGTGGSGRSIVIALIVMCIAAFFVVRFLMNRKAAEGAGGRTQAYLEERKRERERQEASDEDEDEDDLPEDPAEAMRILQQRHDEQ